MLLLNIRRIGIRQMIVFRDKAQDFRHQAGDRKWLYQPKGRHGWDFPLLKVGGLRNSAEQDLSGAYQ